MGSLPHSEVKIGIVDLRGRSVGRCPILRSVRQPHAAWQGERTNRNTSQMSVCTVQGLKCDTKVREAGGKSLTLVPGSTRKTCLKSAIQ